MNVTRDIVKDLLPLYVAGEGSEDTRALVASFLASDPELAGLAEALRADDLAAPRLPAAPPGPGHAELLRTKTLLRRRTWLLAMALCFTGLPFSFIVDDQGFRFLLWSGAPAFASASLALAAALWIAYAVTARRLRVSGL